MDWMKEIIDWLDTASQWFYSAYEITGDWVTPFNYLATPMYFLYNVFYYLTSYFQLFSDWVDDVVDKIKDILDFDAIQDYFQDIFNAAVNAWNWVKDSFDNIIDIVDDWWDEVTDTVTGWIDDAKDAVIDLLGELAEEFYKVKDAWDEFTDKIPGIDDVYSWWKDRTSNILTIITDWWFGVLEDVKDLIDTAFKDREGLWSGWQEIRDNVVEFFDDPLDWIYGKMDDFFERFW